MKACLFLASAILVPPNLRNHAYWITSMLVRDWISLATIMQGCGGLQLKSFDNIKFTFFLIDRIGYNQWGGSLDLILLALLASSLLGGTFRSSTRIRWSFLFSSISSSITCWCFNSWNREKLSFDDHLKTSRQLCINACTCDMLSVFSLQLNKYVCKL